MCEKSPYFAAMFQGKFVETTKNAVTLEEVEGVVSVRSFIMLLEWIYLDRIDDCTAHDEEQVSALIEFARFADMCMVSEGIFDLIQHALLGAIKSHWSNVACSGYLHHVTKEYIDSAMCLPMGNPVRKLMVSACVKGFLGQAPFKFEEETRSIDGFAADLLYTVRDTLKDATFSSGAINYVDPLALDGTRKILFCRRETAHKR